MLPLTQLLFFVPLALGALAVEAIGTFLPARTHIAKHITGVVVAWIFSSALLYLVMSVFTPNDGLRHMPTLLAAYAAPFLLISSVLPSVKWSRPGRVMFSLAVCAGSALLCVMFLLMATCAFQANCL